MPSFWKTKIPSIKLTILLLLTDIVNAQINANLTSNNATVGGEDGSQDIKSPATMGVLLFIIVIACGGGCYHRLKSSVPQSSVQTPNVSISITEGRTETSQFSSANTSSSLHP